MVHIINTVNLTVMTMGRNACEKSQIYIVYHKSLPPLIHGSLYTFICLRKPVLKIQILVILQYMLHREIAPLIL